MIQAGVEFLGQAMPELVKSNFGSLKYVALFQVLAAAARMVGSGFGGALAGTRLGLKWTYLGANLAKVASVGTMVGLLVTHHMTLPLMMIFYGINGFFTGISLTAESSIPARVIGQDQDKLEGFWAKAQFTIEPVGILGPIAAGWVMANLGVNLTMAFFPVMMLASVVYLAKFLSIPKENDPKFLAEVQAKGGLVGAVLGIFKDIAKGFKIVMKTPVLRTSFLGYSAYLMTNPFLYSIVAYAFGGYVASAGGPATATVQAWVAGIYSFGGMIAAWLMLREKKKVEERRKKGEIDEAGARALSRASTLRWMLIGAAALAGFIPMIWANPYAAYAGMFLFGVGSVPPTLKLKSVLQSLSPKADVEKVMGFVQAGSILSFTAGIFGLGALFDAFPGREGFLYMNAAFGVLAALYLVLWWVLSRQTRPSGPPAK